MPDRSEPLAFTSVGPINAVGGADAGLQRGGASARFSGWSFFSNIRDSGGFFAPERAPIGEGGRGGVGASDRFTISTLPGEVGSKGIMAPFARKGARRADALEDVTPSARRVAPDTTEMAAQISPEVTPVFNQSPAASSSYRFSALFMQRARMSALLRVGQARAGADVESAAPQSSEPLGKPAAAAAAGEAPGSSAKKMLIVLALVLCMTVSIFLIVNPGGALTLRGVAAVEFVAAAQKGNQLIVQQDNNAVSGSVVLIVSNTGQDALINAIEGDLSTADGLRIARVSLGSPGALKVPVNQQTAQFVQLRIVQDGTLSPRTLEALKTRCTTAQDGADAQLALSFVVTVTVDGTPSTPISIQSLSRCRYSSEDR